MSIRRHMVELSWPSLDIIRVLHYCKYHFGTNVFQYGGTWEYQPVTKFSNMDWNREKHDYKFYFKNKEDAVQFKLRWL